MKTMIVELLEEKINNKKEKLNSLSEQSEE
jgi:hypothetical protein